MSSFSALSFAFVVVLSAHGCFRSHQAVDYVDSGLDEAGGLVETGSMAGMDMPRSGSGAVGSGHGGVERGVVRPMDAGNIGGRGGIAAAGGTGGRGGIAAAGGTSATDVEGDDGGMSDAPCAPNCPALEWVEIPGGTFLMGVADPLRGEDNQSPQHEVTVKTFKMLKAEVTVRQYRTCVDAGACSVPVADGYLHNWGRSGREHYPMNGVDWYRAREFAEWIGARLPSEAEWEYAARSGGQDIVYPWGVEEISCDLAVLLDCSPEAMQVCSKPMGNTEQGLCDMAGNVIEWVEDDWHESYDGAPSDGRAWVDDPRGDRRAVRGGSWLSTAWFCRAASRYKHEDDYRNYALGFRVVLDS